MTLHGGLKRATIHFFISHGPRKTENNTRMMFVLKFRVTSRKIDLCYVFFNTFQPEKSWMLGIGSMNGVEHKPNLMLAWVTGPYAKVVESIPEDVVLRQTKEFLQRFLGGSHNLTEPTVILR